jgi:hypothetical protein
MDTLKMYRQYLVCHACVKRNTIKLLGLQIALGITLTLLALPALAVRPFVTDDARIIDTGQVEVESWMETTRADQQWNPVPGFNFIGGVSVNQWLEILAGSGLGNNRNGGSSVGNPVLQGKFLLKKAEVNGAAGYAFSIGKTFNRGHGAMHEDGSVLAAIGMTSFRLQDDDIQIHVNYGWRQDNERGFSKRTRPYWGIGADVQTPLENIRYVAEVFAGDPLVLNAPRHAVQTGLRWMKSDYIQMDLTFGAEPRIDRPLGRLGASGGYEFTAQLGLRMLFDTFTSGGRPGRVDGADGFFATN